MMESMASTARAEAEEQRGKAMADEQRGVCRSTLCFRIFFWVHLLWLLGEEGQPEAGRAKVVMLWQGLGDESKRKEVLVVDGWVYEKEKGPAQKRGGRGRQNQRIQQYREEDYDDDGAGNTIRFPSLFAFQGPDSRSRVQMCSVPGDGGDLKKRR